MKINGIYQIQSIIKPERIYIGSAIDIRPRWRVHLSDLRHNKHHSKKLQRHFNKYGESDLVFIIVELCFPEFLTAREQFYINKLKPYFNCSPTAGSNLGIKRSIETKRRMSEVMIRNGRKPPSQKGNTYWLGKHHSEESKRKMSENNGMKGKTPWNTGKIMSDEHNRKLSEAAKNRPPISEELRKRMSESGKKAWINRKLKIA